jgi:hypothetical protein
MEVGVCVVVGVGVKGIGRMVGVIDFVELIRVVSYTTATGDSWVTMGLGVTLCCDNATVPQAGKRINTTQTITRLLSTLAVYHKINQDC